MKSRMYLRETHDMDKKNILHGDVMRKFTICNCVHERICQQIIFRNICGTRHVTLKESFKRVINIATPISIDRLIDCSRFCDVFDRENI